MTIDINIKIEEEILKYLYELFPDFKIFTRGIVPLKELGLDPQEDRIEYEKVFDFLNNNYYVEKDGFQISITFKGIYYYEEKYLNSEYYYIKAIKIILEFLEDLENGKYPDYMITDTEVIDKLKKEGISLDNKEFNQFLVFLEHRTSLFKNIALPGIHTRYEIKAYTRDKPILTPNGRTFLNNWRYKPELFKNVSDPLRIRILHEEYNELQKIIQQGCWKDACIKIGGILEYLLTIWLQGKGLTPPQIAGSKKIRDWKYIRFHKMIKFYMNNTKEYANEIGTYTDWKIVKNILKNYRNYVHLLKYEKRVKKGDFLRKDEFDRIYPIFQDFLKKF